MIALIDRARNMYGPLVGDARARLDAVLADPSEATWENAYTLVVNGSSVTLWAAWVAVDAEAPRFRRQGEAWSRIPSQLVLRRALRWATDPS